LLLEAFLTLVESVMPILVILPLVFRRAGAPAAEASLYSNIHCGTIVLALWFQPGLPRWRGANPS